MRVAALCFFLPSVLTAAEPVAVRLWPGGGVSVEPFDGQAVACGLAKDDIARMSDPPVRTLPTDDRVAFVEAGGLKVLIVRDVRSEPEPVDVLVLPEAASWAGATWYAKRCDARTVILPLTATERPEGVRVVPHNSTAVAAAADGPPTLIALGDTPYEMSGELAALFKAKEAACEASREVFAPLSAAQMNFRPADGSHTPRWNAEHMRGRELLFFSQIYNALDPAVPVMNTNPAQMPPDYEAAHPDWSGQREAEEMRRVEAFTRRHAYLLDGLDLDKKAPGSRFWTPRGLLKQMDRHYAQHTANVKKKFEAADWPVE